MVDFNNETTIGRPAVDVERILVLQRRDAIIDSFETWHQQDALGGQPPTAYIKARCKSLYLQIQGMLNRRKGTLSTDIQALLQKDDYDSLVKGFQLMSEFLDTLRLTRIDTRSNFDSTNVEEDNKHAGL